MSYQSFCERSMHTGCVIIFLFLFQFPFYLCLFPNFCNFMARRCSKTESSEEFRFLVFLFFCEMWAHGVESRAQTRPWATSMLPISLFCPNCSLSGLVRQYQSAIGSFHEHIEVHRRHSALYSTGLLSFSLSCPPAIFLLLSSLTYVFIMKRNHYLQSGTGQEGQIKGGHI